MIKYNLKCQNNHEFESWFSDSDEFEKLEKKKLLECIYCSSKKIKKSIMAPMVSVINEKNNEIQKLNKQFKNEKEKLIKLRNYVEKNFEYVGENFPSEVRNVYYDKKKNKNIYGKATPEETEELKEEGIELTSIPWIDNKRDN